MWKFKGSTNGSKGTSTTMFGTPYGNFGSPSHKKRAKEGTLRAQINKASDFIQLLCN